MRFLGTKVVVAGGLSIVAIGLFIMSRATPTSGYALIGISIPVIGLGMGLTMAPATDSIMGSVPRANAGSRLGRQRHDAPGRRRARCGDPRQHALDEL